MEVTAAALVFVVALVAMLLAYFRMRYWQRQARSWQQRLKAQLDVLRGLIRDARETQHAYREAADPVRLHTEFIARCETAIRIHLGAAYVTRVERRMSEDWLQPPGLASEEHIFAWSDTERRIAALQELITETADDLASIAVS